MIPEIDQTAAKIKFKTATFALGCFWGPDTRFGGMPSVLRTRVGYAGGTTENPNYHLLSDYIEATQFDYDPTKINYAELLDFFWQAHDPAESPWKRQYLAAIFYHDKEQLAAANETKATVEKNLGSKIYTEILPAEPFYLAEDYHQKYRLQQVPQLLSQFQDMYPELMDFINSTAAARVNGILGGYGDLATLEHELKQFGLNPEIQNWLWELAVESNE